MNNTTAVILAAGKGTRMKLGQNKMFYKLRKPILIHTIEAFDKNEDIDEIIIVANENELHLVEELVKENGFKKVSSVIAGGSVRQESSYNGVMHAQEAKIIILHDGARPFIRQDVISNSIKDALEHGASVVGVPSKDTIKISKKDNFVKLTPDRSRIWIVQTPQTFMVGIILGAHKKARLDKFVGTDDSSLVERLGYKVKLTIGHYDNIKLTTPDDLKIAEKLIKTD